MMSVLINHCWCSECHWDNDNYGCRVIVSIDCYEKRENIFADKTTLDWQNLLIEDDTFEDKETRNFGTVRLKPEVVEWLKTNVKDRPPEEGEHIQGWAVGNDSYNAKSSSSFAIFFERPRDAMKFIKFWSSYKNPVHYLNYFDDIRRELDSSTGHLKRVPR